MKRKLAVIGVGNMAKAILQGMVKTNFSVSDLILYDKNPEQYQTLTPPLKKCIFAESIESALASADCVLLSVKPQNFPEILSEIKKVSDFDTKLYISIAAGLDSHSISDELNGACVIRSLPNLPMTIGMGVSLICENSKVSSEDMDFVQHVFRASGSVVMIREEEMNRMIGVTSSSPAYVFRMIDAMYHGALQQGLPDNSLVEVICDMVIGAATLLKQSGESPQSLIAKVSSKGGTTERTMQVFNRQNFDDIIQEAMVACTQRADELGEKK